MRLPLRTREMMGVHKDMAKRAKAKRIQVQWNAVALAKALSKTENEAQAWILSRALAIKLIDDTKADEIQAQFFEDNKAEEQTQLRLLSESLMRRWMRPRRLRKQRRALSVRG